MTKSKKGAHREKVDSLDVIHIFLAFVPHVGHVGGVSHCLALEQSILGHVERGAFGRDDYHRRTCGGNENKKG